MDSSNLSLLFVLKRLKALSVFCFACYTDIDFCLRCFRILVPAVFPLEFVLFVVDRALVGRSRAMVLRFILP
jgi:hypothetical protein